VPTRWSIRKKLYFVLALLLVVVGVLAWSSIHGHYAYRAVVRSINRRVPELPLANDFNTAVGELRVYWYAAGVDEEPTSVKPSPAAIPQQTLAEHLTSARNAFQHYRRQLIDGLSVDTDSPIADNRQERETTHAIEATLAEIARIDAEEKGDVRRTRLTGEIDRLQKLADRLPTFLHGTIEESMEAARSQYRTLIVVWWFTSLTTVVTTVWLVLLFYNWVFRPLRVLVKGSRKIASGQFGYRIHLDTRDEMSELAKNMNDMTERFQTIRDDLDRQVAERTQQVVRGEQLASVGFLAAGVAHEINNPLASIAVCAESLKGRLGSLVADDHPDRRVVMQYLGMMEKEAFRCKEITEKLLDFSRIGETKRQPADLRALVQDVVEMVQTLGKYEGKRISVSPGPTVFAVVNGREIKQVVLNLITNALDSVDDGGGVTIEFRTAQGEVDIVFTDDGCGMTEEVRAHLFEPFFTRRRQGQGTGLGLSISYRIIADHRGSITAYSDGPGHGSQFHVHIPTVAAHQETSHQSQAA
jgi:two-component system NtrC family sensor kinase